ncbi:MAG TPA: TolC family protein, partial [Marinobacter sp.]|nr:TolC family protein [Marinobacter sp.]
MIHRSPLILLSLARPKRARPEWRLASAIITLTACVVLAGCATQIATPPAMPVNDTPLRALAWAPELQAAALNST